MTARLSPAQPPFTPEIQAWLDRVMPKDHAPLVLFTTLARDARLFGKFFAAGMLDRGHLTLRQRELVIDRITAQCGSEYEWGVHIAFFAERIGLDECQIQSLVFGQPEDSCWNDTEKVLLRLCDALHRCCTVSDELWADLRGRFSDEAILELLMLAGFYTMVSYVTNGLCLPLEPYARRFPPKPQ
jgi:alkylhydroperoxidase family enzyme